MSKKKVFWLIAILIFLLDQGVKILIQKTMFEGQTIPVLPPVFHITYILNPGAAFGIMAYQTWFLVALAVAVILAAVIFQKKIMEQCFILRLAIAWELAGTTGNLLDRMRLGKVVDFLDFRVWPIFNIADMAIVGGVILLFYYFLFLDKKQ